MMREKYECFVYWLVHFTDNFEHRITQSYLQDNARPAHSVMDIFKVKDTTDIPDT